MGRIANRPGPCHAPSCPKRLIITARTYHKHAPHVPPSTRHSMVPQASHISCATKYNQSSEWLLFAFLENRQLHIKYIRRNNLSSQVTQSINLETLIEYMK